MKTPGQMQGVLCEDFEVRGYCWHSVCALVEDSQYQTYIDAQDEANRYPEHDCPKNQFLEDPITQAYGVGSEMVGLISCAVCDRREEL